MLKTTVQTIQSHADGFDLTGGIRVLSGNPVQTFNKDTNEYEPDHTLVPVVLMPWVQAADEEGIMTGEQAITGADWYEGAPKKDNSNLITSATEGYAISATGMPTYSLSVKKNVPADKPLEIYCVFSFTNKKRAVTARLEDSVVLRSTVFDSANFSLKLDMPSSYTVNPLEAEDDENGAWPVTYNAQLYNGTEAVPDAEARYWWQVKDTDGWRAFTEDEQQLYVTVSGRTLTVNAKMVCGVDMYRVLAAYVAPGATEPTSAPTSAWQCPASLRLEMPKTLRVMPVQTAGMRMRAALTTPVKYECRVLYNRGEITGKDDLFQFTWKGKSAKTGEAEKTIGTGKTVRFTPSTLFPAGYNVDIWCEVKTFSCCAFVTSGGSYVTDSTGALVTAKQYE